MLPVEFGGEAILTIGRARLFAAHGARLIVNVAPFGCMPGTLTSALCRELQTRIGVPVVSLFYDGEQGVNDRLAVFINNLGVTHPPAVQAHPGDTPQPAEDVNRSLICS